MHHHATSGTCDQADALRRLVAQQGLPSAETLPDPSRRGEAGRQRLQVVVVAGGKGGVGTTTLAANMAVAAVQSGRRCLLVDVDGDCGDVATLTAVSERHTVADVLARRRRLSECLQRGPAGIAVLAGAWGFERLSDHPPASAEVLLRQVLAMSGELDSAIFDCGDSRCSLTERFWKAADTVLMVTSVEPAAILDAYSAIKQMYPRHGHGRLLSVVNMATHIGAAESVQQRIAEACQRFLGITATAAGAVCRDKSVEAANRCGTPVVLQYPDCRASREIRALTERVLGIVQASQEGANVNTKEILKIRASGGR